MLRDPCGAERVANRLPLWGQTAIQAVTVRDFAGGPFSLVAGWGYCGCSHLFCGKGATPYGTGPSPLFLWMKSNRNRALRQDFFGFSPCIVAVLRKLRGRRAALRRGAGLSERRANRRPVGADNICQVRFGGVKWEKNACPGSIQGVS
jgi:hypothetical protein